jgi:predicted MFS family arabinose efflux permease
VMLLVGAAIGPPAGVWIDRLGPRRTLCAGSPILAASLTLLAMAQGPAVYFLAWAGIGLGVPTGLSIAAHAALARAAPSTARRAIGTLMLFTGLASAVFWPVTSFLVGSIGWRPTCLIFAALHLVVCLPLHLALPATSVAPPPQPSPAEPNSTEPAPAASWTVSPAQRRTALYLLAGTLSLQGFVSWGLSLHLISLFQSFGLSAATAVLVASLTGPVTVAIRILDIQLGKWLHPLVVAGGALAVLPFTFLLLLFAHSSTASVAAFTILWSAANGIISVARATLPLTLFGAEGFARLMGWLSLPQNMAYALAPLAFSAIIERSGPSTALVVSLVSVLLSLTAILALARVVGTRKG